MGVQARGTRPDGPVGAAARPQRECAADVGRSVLRRQRGLGRSRPHAAQEPPHRQAEAPGQVVRLVETPRQRPPRMERDGHHHVGCGQQVGAGAAQQYAQGIGQHALPSVLEGVNDLAERTVVAASRTHHAERRLVGLASRTGLVARPGTRQRIAAARARGSGNRENAAPAGRTNGVAKWLVECARARHALRREEASDERVACLCEHGGSPTAA